MPPLAVIAGIGVATLVVGTAVQIDQGNKAAKATQKSQQFEQQKNELQQAIQRRDAIRSARISSAKAKQAAENQGAANTSASQGGLGSISSQLSSNLSFLDNMSNLSSLSGKALGEAARHQTYANAAGAVAGLGSAVAGNARTIFGG